MIISCPRQSKKYKSIVSEKGWYKSLLPIMYWSLIERQLILNNIRPYLLIKYSFNFITGKIETRSILAYQGEVLCCELWWLWRDPSAICHNCHQSPKVTKGLVCQAIIFKYLKVVLLFLPWSYVYRYCL